MIVIGRREDCARHDFSFVLAVTSVAGPHSSGFGGSRKREAAALDIYVALQQTAQHSSPAYSGPTVSGATDAFSPNLGWGSPC
jgi:hypothetical protein